MTDPHEQFPQLHMPDFMQPFDGSQPPVSPEEQAAVGTKFDSFVDDLMLAHIDAVHNMNPRNPRWPRNALVLDVPVSDGVWSAKITSGNLPDRDEAEMPVHALPDKGISLLFTDAEGHDREEFNYGLGADGIVRREDMGDDWAEQQLEQQLKDEGLLPDRPPLEFPLHASKEERDAFFSRMLAESASDDGSNEDLEMAMGQNNQPVGMQELDGLIDMLTAPEAQPHR